MAWAEDGSSAVDCTPPPALAQFYSQWPQQNHTLSTGAVIKLPFYSWGSGLGVVGSVPLKRAQSALAPYQKQPFPLLGSDGKPVLDPRGQPYAMGLLVSFNYDGSCAGPYQGAFLALLVQDNAFCNETGCAPGMMLFDYYTSTQIAVDAGEVWGFDKTLARVKNRFGMTARRSSIAVRGRPVLRMAWNDLEQQHTTGPSFVPANAFVAAAGGKVPATSFALVVSSEAPFNPIKDRFWVNPASSLGRRVKRLGFFPVAWSFRTSQGVFFPPTQPQ